MKAKLIKNNSDGWVHYYLKDENGITIGTTKYPFPPELNRIAKSKGVELVKLSLKNCKAIECGYDLDELVESKYPNFYNEDYEYDSEAEMLRDEYKSRGFREGAKAILEILGDKKFSDADVKLAINLAWDDDNLTTTEIIQSLQQTEWEVEVGTIEYGIGNDENGRPVFDTRYRLDSDGCLILKLKSK
jgi:hypothetical protein